MGMAHKIYGHGAMDGLMHAESPLLPVRRPELRDLTRSIAIEGPHPQ